jgi:hypothetical protein
MAWFPGLRHVWRKRIVKMAWGPWWGVHVWRGRRNAHRGAYGGVGDAVGKSGYVDIGHGLTEALARFSLFWCSNAGDCYYY